MLPTLVLALFAALPIQEGGGSSLPPAVCFAVGTPESYLAEVHAALGAVPEYNLGNRWSGPIGSPRTVTWSLIPDGVSIPSAGSWDNNGNAGNSELFSRLDSEFGSRALWIQRIQESFDRWEALSGVDYQRITFGGNDWDDGAGWGESGNADRGDVRIAMRPIDGGGGVLAWNSFPAEGSGGNMVLDRWENLDSSSNQNRFFRNILTHEMGHGIGFHHVCSSDSDQLMEPFIDTSYDGPRQDDLRAAVYFYGDAFEPNDSAAAATDIGTLVDQLDLGDLPDPLTGSNGPGTALLGLERNGENDYYRFTIQASSLVDLTLTPVGTTYFDDDQDFGSCPGGTFQTNAATIANLNVQIIAPDGTSVVAEASAEPAGSVEVLIGAALDTPGDYFVRVFEDSNQGEVQLYRFSLTRTPFLSNFCDGYDGALALCPCGNPGTPDSGCDVAQGSGGVELVVLGQEAIPTNRVTMRGAGFPVTSTPAAVVIRSGSLEPVPVTFGDGLRCIGVPLVRLGASTALFGISDHTFGHGQAAGPGEFYYQLWFRNTPAMFCTPDGFNLSNGRALTW